jgi:phage terminase large subunit-like protein
MVEGESGILAISPDPERPLYEPSKRRLTWSNGAVATTYSADEPERLRGPTAPRRAIRRTTLMRWCGRSANCWSSR